MIEARNGKEGLEKVKEERPDLIILDVMMDSATDGFQVALKLRNPDPESEFKGFDKTPILMLTTIHTTTPVRFGTDADYLPVDMFIEKPIQPDLLAQKVKAMLQAEAAESPA